VPLLAYALFGPSRILVLGPDSSLAPVILAVVLPLSGGDAMRAVALASMMAVVSGLVCVLIGVLRLGSSRSSSPSHPLRLHERHRAHSADQPAAEALGFSIDDAGPLRDLVRITEGVRGQVNWTSFAVGAGTLAAILLLKPYKRIPGLLLAVVAATIVVGILNLDSTAGVKVLGPLPQGCHRLHCR
jgi:Sulfate permease and related transporters (MFS superfamily)